MAPSWVLKLPLADTDGGAVVVHVTRKEGKDGKDLDLDLLATDGDAAYRGKVRNRNLPKLRAKNYEGSEKEWSDLLKHVLVGQSSSDLSDAVRNNLDVSCAIAGKDPQAILSVSLRTKVEQITQKLGSIELSQTEETDDVDLFGWASQVISQRDGLETEVETAREKASMADQTIKSLQSQLDELIKAKKEHENELLAKFALLLNEKKLQLRKLQRQIATAKMDPRKLTELEQSLPPDAEESSRRGKKRSARDRAQADESEESDDAFEKMDVDESGRVSDEPGSDEDRQTTPSEATASDEEDLDPPQTSQTEAGPAGPSQPPADSSEHTIPARRELPFARKGKQKEQETRDPSPPKTRSADKVESEDEETASEDDEL